MTGPRLDETDYAILRALQEDARNNTNAAISERVSVSASTVGKRISRLEEHGVIRAHRSDVDYEAAGYSTRVLFVCTAPLRDREALVERALDLDGVVNVRELMTGRENVHVQVVGASDDDVERVAQSLVDMGYQIADGSLLQAEHDRPSIRPTDAAPEG